MTAARFALAAAMLAAAPSPSPAFAQGAKTTSAVELARMADALKPGDWVWAPAIAPEGPVTVYVDLSRQLATVYRNGVRIGVTTVSTGKPGHETPDGIFTILQKDATHRSTKYNNARMPYMQRLTWDGVALHAGGLPGYPESHGCIHLPYAFAQELFGITSLGATVVVAGHAGAPVLSRSAGVLAPVDAGGIAAMHDPLPDGEDYRWTPDRSPSGPVTIILSKGDQRAVVLRNGVEIGRARAQIPDEDFSTHVLTLSKGADGKSQWIFVGVPGHADETGHVLDSSVTERVRVPQTFYAAVRHIIVPGTTIVVTQSGVGATTTGQKLTLLDGTPQPPGP